MSIHDMLLPDFLERMSDGSIRVAGHRVLLFHVLDAIYSEGDDEDIGDIYPTIPPDKMRRVLAFCVKHADEVREYHEEERRASEAVRLATTGRGPSRDDLLRRLNL